MTKSLIKHLAFGSFFDYFEDGFQSFYLNMEASDSNICPLELLELMCESYHMILPQERCLRSC